MSLRKRTMSEEEYKTYLAHFNHVAYIDNRGRILVPKSMSKEIEPYGEIIITFGKNQNQVVIDFIPKIEQKRDEQ